MNVCEVLKNVQFYLFLTPKSILIFNIWEDGKTRIAKPYEKKKKKSGQAWLKPSHEHPWGPLYPVSQIGPLRNTWSLI